MLNKIINAHVSQTNNEINELTYLNAKKKEINKEKYKKLIINEKNFFKSRNKNIRLNYSSNHLQLNLNNTNINNNQTQFNISKNVKKFSFENLKEETNNTYIHNNQIQFNMSDNIKKYRFNDLRYNIDKIRNNLNEDSINANIKKINNVYKKEFINAPTTGFGDFIRGCYFLLEFCDKLNISLEFHIYDSNIKHFIKYFSLKENINENIAKNIYKFTKINSYFTKNNDIINYNVVNNNDEFIKFINSQNIYSNNIFINTVNFPSNFISKKFINYIKNILEPTDIFKKEINNLIDKIGLNKNNYITYHIRLGDNYFKNQFEAVENHKLQQIIDKLDINNNNNYLLVSDSTIIKHILTKKYSKIKTIKKDAIHTGEINDVEKIKNTLLDFYLMSHSKQIISFSVYPHGSGFSKWCATTYEIPYLCYAL